MKKLILICMVLTMNFTVFAQDSQEVENNLYRLESLVKNNTLRIERRGLAPEINRILLDAYSQIESSLTRRPGRRPGRGGGRPGRGGGRPGPGRGSVDMTLVSVALNSCANLSTWSGRTSCFKNYFTGARGLLGTINQGCGSINSDQNSATCYTNALKATEPNVTVETVASAGCSSLGTWSSRKTCFNGMLSDSYSYLASILYGACSAVDSDQQGATCYTNGLGSQEQTSSAKLILAACSQLGTWSSRVECFRAGVSAADSLGENLGIYVRGCAGISSSSQEASCYTRSLQTIQ